MLCLSRCRCDEKVAGPRVSIQCHHNTMLAHKILKKITGPSLSFKYFPNGPNKVFPIQTRRCARDPLALDHPQHPQALATVAIRGTKPTSECSVVWHSQMKSDKKTVLQGDTYRSRPPCHSSSWWHDMVRLRSVDASVYPALLCQAKPNHVLNAPF